MSVKKNLKKHFAEKNHSVFEGLEGGPFKHNKKKCLKNVLNFFQHS